MSNFLAYGKIEQPNQGSRNQSEYIRLFENEDLQLLQIQVNDYLEYLSGPQVLRRPSIRDIQFHSVALKPETGVIKYHYAKIHFVLVGDDTTPPNL